MSKRQSRDPEKEQAILAAATHEFAKKGYFKANTQTIADAAEVSKGSVFRYFESKKKLYIQAVRFAIQRLQEIADFTVWTDAPDLRTLIIRATQYKIALSHEYPDEFALLLAVYRQGATAPEALQTEVQQMFTQFSDQNIKKLIQPVIKRLNLRSDIAPEEIQSYVELFMAQIMTWVQHYMVAHPEVQTMEDMTELVTKIEHFMDLMEHGIVKSE
ncbi:TetR/AcrR family transcriptional regulator [Agrilactobacillus yilanensis]|uniref:TetR/AcrR family transcriptional regulator n=1 Tax=Agrilactobacillus yilanensis TaxID=2485997 RepID=A0ABW4JAH9_9LACO|nr:TetR/AcrR family transcriptional regulator [Agrilactobacillus yilanensis]